jgi:hypothetical protein
MMTKTRYLALIVGASSICGCGGDDLPDGDSLGDGNNVLTVSASVEASALFDNARDRNDFATTFEVQLSRSGVDVDDAIVTIESDAGVIDLVRDGGGEYQGAQGGYHEIYRLDVDAGVDFVHGVRIDGPDIHTFRSPIPGATVPGNQDLIVEWDRGERAESVQIETRAMDQLSIDDGGEFAVPASGLDWDNEEIRDERIRLERTNRLSPAGAAGESSLGVTVRNQIEILVAP